jgi:site-specific DNA recombinase
MEPLLTAYQEDLLSLNELRRRMPELRAREESVSKRIFARIDDARLAVPKRRAQKRPAP